MNGYELMPLPHLPNRVMRQMLLQARYSLPSHRRAFCSAVLALTALALPAEVLMASPQPPDAAILPLVGTDVIVQYNPRTGQLTQVTGVIENLRGGTLELRRSGFQVDRISLAEISELHFRKPPHFASGLQQLRQDNPSAALPSLTLAVSMESRSWMLCEIRAAMASAFTLLRQWDDAVAQIDQIVALDPETRHTTLLPLVWDDRLPDAERCQMSSDDLKSASVPRRLTAASALLHESQWHASAVQVLNDLQRSGAPYVRELAEAQLWRERLRHPERLRTSDTIRWKSRLRHWSRELRSGPEFVLGRALMLQNDFDGAVLSFLWMPTMAPREDALTASSLREAANALEQAGRGVEAVQIRAELRQRFPESSAAQSLNRTP